MWRIWALILLKVGPNPSLFLACLRFDLIQILRKREKGLTRFNNFFLSLNVGLQHVIRDQFLFRFS